MSIDKSLKKGGGLTAGNVLTRAERLARLQEDERWSPAKCVFNLPKQNIAGSHPASPASSRPRRRIAPARDGSVSKYSSKEHNEFPPASPSAFFSVSRGA